MTVGVFRVTPPERPTRRRLRRAVARLVSFASPRGGGSRGGGASGGRGKLRVLMYHRVNDAHPGDRLTVTPAAFDDQMRYLADHYRVLPLAEAMEALRAGGGGGVDEIGDARPTAALTFDDGYRDNYEVAFPVLERRGLRATFFLVSANLGSPKSIARYAACCDGDGDGSLTVDQARELLSCGHEIGSHGRSHRELAALTAADARSEIEGSRDELTRAVGSAPRSFCYPRGSESAAVRGMVEDAGYDFAVTVYPGPNGTEADPFALRRTEISGDDDPDDFRMKLAGGFDGWHHLLQRVKSRRSA